MCYSALTCNSLAAFVTNLFYDNDKYILEEIPSLDSFKYALRKENRLLFNKMPKECQKEDK